MKNIGPFTIGAFIGFAIAILMYHPTKLVPEKLSISSKNNTVQGVSNLKKETPGSVVIPGQIWKSKSKNPYNKVTLYYKVLDISGDYVQYRYCINDIKNIDDEVKSSIGSDRIDFFIMNVKMSDSVTTK